MERKRWKGIYDSVVGLVFFGTPFRGTRGLLSQGEILDRAYALFAGPQTPVYTENLDILRTGESLVNLVNNYQRIARRSAMPRTICFYEQQASDVGAILGMQHSQACNYLTTFYSSELC